MNEMNLKIQTSKSTSNCRGGILATKILISIFYAALFVCSGWLYLSLHQWDHHWLNRVGGSIIIISLGFSLLQFWYERWMETRLWRIEKGGILEEKFNNIGFSIPEAGKNAELVRMINREKMERMRLNILCHAVTCAIVGEILHSFGDMLID